MRNSPPIRFLLRVCCFLPLALAIVPANWVYEQPFVEHRVANGLRDMTDKLLAGETIYSNKNLRLFKRAWISRLPTEDILVLGGSRTMAIEERWFRPASLFNTAVLGADLDDSIAMLEACLESGQKPRIVILDIRPALARRDTSEDRSAIAPYLRRAIVRLGLSPPARTYSELFSFDSFLSNLSRIRQPARGMWLSAANWMVAVHPDGSMAMIADPSPEQAAASARKALARAQPEPSAPDATDLRILQRFLDDLQTRGIRVIVYLGPVHPLAYATYAKTGRYDEAWIRHEAASRRIQVVGSYAPSNVGATEADFLDDIHARANLVERIFRGAGVAQSEPRP